MRPTKNQRVHLSRIARWCRDSFGIKPGQGQRLKVRLRAWELEGGRLDGTAECYHVLIDLDSKEVLEKERIAWHPKMDRCGKILENEIKQYHDFLRITDKRRGQWLKEEWKALSANATSMSLVKSEPG